MSYQDQVGQVLAYTMGAFFLLALVAVLAGAVTAWWQCTRDERRAAKRAARAKAAL